MKNVHVIPTDKPSRLWINNLLQGKLELSNDALVGSNTAQHIYITNSEKPKSGDYAINVDNELVQLNQSTCIFYDSKVVLCSDSDLIKDGVQSINDDFLQWFVKNPSCEYVEVKVEFIQTPDNLKDGFYYKIIIPQEEPNKLNLDKLESKLDKALKNETKESLTEWLESKRNKKETLEEASERCFKEMQALNPKGGLKEFIRMAVNFGAKWKQEQDKKMYSDEEVLNILRNYKDCQHSLDPKPLIKWFEQFKKK
jgi:hypothetical protein